MMFLLKFGVEQTLKMECFVCAGEGEEGDAHTCEWSEDDQPSEKLELLNSVGIAGASFEAFIGRVRTNLPEIPAPSSVTGNVEGLRQKCTTHILNGPDVSVELDHLMRHLTKIEDINRGDVDWATLY